MFSTGFISYNYLSCFLYDICSVCARTLVWVVYKDTNLHDMSDRGIAM